MVVVAVALALWLVLGGVVALALIRVVRVRDRQVPCARSGCEVPLREPPGVGPVRPVR